MSLIRPAVRRVIPVQARLRLHWALVGSRRLSEMFARVNPYLRMSRVSASTRLVIDGYPRSGNSYARAAFEYANADIPISTHRHSPRSIEAGIRRGIPVIVLIRQPRQAIVSALQYEPTPRPDWAIDLYRWFYQGILPLTADALIATFEEVTGDFGHVIRNCNARFGSDFVPYHRTDDSEKTVSDMIDEAARKEFSDDLLPRVTARPSAVRRSVDEVLADLDERLMERLDHLDSLYDAVLARR